MLRTKKTVNSVSELHWFVSPLAFFGYICFNNWRKYHKASNIWSSLIECKVQENTLAALRLIG